VVVGTSVEVGAGLRVGGTIVADGWMAVGTVCEDIIRGGAMNFWKNMNPTIPSKRMPMKIMSSLPVDLDRVVR
jgi:hypothetical protein